MKGTWGVSSEVMTDLRITGQADYREIYYCTQCR